MVQEKGISKVDFLFLLFRCYDLPLQLGSPFSSKIESLYAGMILPSSTEIDREVLEKMPKRFSVMNRQRVFRIFSSGKLK